jgi:hypothetical protein
VSGEETLIVHSFLTTLLFYADAFPFDFVMKILVEESVEAEAIKVEVSLPSSFKVY